MDQSFNTSFIPKNQPHGAFVTPGQENGSVVRNRSDGSFGLFFFLSAIVFFLTILGSVGMFVYIKVVEGSVDSKVAEATALNERYKADVETINDLRRMSVRLKEANKLLVDHRALSGIVAQLEEVTLRDVRYVSFSFKESAGGSAEHALTLSGEARTFGHVAKQIDKYTELNALFRTPVVTTLESGNGMVRFVAEMGVVPGYANFGKVIDSGVYDRKNPSTTRPAVQFTPEASQGSSASASSSTASTTAAEERDR